MNNPRKLTNKKTILFIVPNYFEQSFGGAEYQIELIIKHLKTKEFIIKYLYIDNFSKVENVLNIDLYSIKKRPLMRRILGRYFVLDSFSLSKTIFSINPDIIYIRTGFAYLGIVVLIQRFFDYKVVFHVASELDLVPAKFENFTLKGFFTYLDKKVSDYGIKNCNSIICQALYQKKMIAKYYKRNDCSVIPNFHPLPRIIHKKSLPIRVIWIANIKLSKQPEIFIQLADTIKKFNKKVIFVMIGRLGNTKFDYRISQMINESKNIVYKGELEQLKVNYEIGKSHIFVNTSLVEGFPNTFIQAMMRKTAIVSLNVNPDNIFASNKLGLFSNNSVKKLIYNVNLLINNPSLRENICTASYEFSLKNYSEKNFEKIESVIQDLN